MIIISVEHSFWNLIHFIFQDCLMKSIYLS